MPQGIEWIGAPPPAGLLPGERLVFVYGTLRRGGANDIARFAPGVRWLGHAQTRGRLYRLGWYPGLILDADADPVRGEVYAVSKQVEAELDRLEEIVPGPQSEYFRRELSLAGPGEQSLCLLYEINPARTLGRERITSGDWFDCAS